MFYLSEKESHMGKTKQNQTKLTKQAKKPQIKHIPGLF